MNPKSGHGSSTQTGICRRRGTGPETSVRKCTFGNSPSTTSTRACTTHCPRSTTSPEQPTRTRAHQLPDPASPRSPRPPRPASHAHRPASSLPRRRIVAASLEPRNGAPEAPFPVAAVLHLRGQNRVAQCRWPCLPLAPPPPFPTPGPLDSPGTPPPSLTANTPNVVRGAPPIRDTGGVPSSTGGVEGSMQGGGVFGSGRRMIDHPWGWVTRVVTMRTAGR